MKIQPVSTVAGLSPSLDGLNPRALEIAKIYLEKVLHSRIFRVHVVRRPDGYPFECRAVKPFSSEPDIQERLRGLILVIYPGGMIVVLKDGKVVNNV